MKEVYKLTSVVKKIEVKLNVKIVAIKMMTGESWEYCDTERATL